MMKLSKTKLCLQNVVVFCCNMGIFTNVIDSKRHVCLPLCCFVRNVIHLMKIIRKNSSFHLWFNKSISVF